MELNSNLKGGFLHYNLNHCFSHITPLEVNFPHPLGSTVGPNCIMLPIHLKSMDIMEEASSKAMVNTGTMGDFIDQD